MVGRRRRTGPKGVLAVETLPAQIVGGIGFAVLIASTFIKRRGMFLTVDAIGLAPVGIHYLMLNAPAGATMCGLYIVMDGIAARLHRGRSARRAYLFVYPAAGVLSALTWTHPWDVAALAGTLLAVASRQQRNQARLKFLIVLSSIGWTMYGVATGSIGQTAFSVMYGSTALFATSVHLREQRTAAQQDSIE